MTVVPVLALGLVGWQLWGDALGWNDVFVFAIMYAVTGLGITVGFHRLFTHRSFKTKRPIRVLLAICGSMAIEGPIISWVADHRKHHAFSDRVGDPHSPHVDHGHGLRGALRGLTHAHVGWLFIHTQRGNRERYAPDLLKDPDIAWVDRTFFVWVGRRLPDSPSGSASRSAARLADGLTGMLWGGLVRMLVAAPRDLLDQLALPLLRPQAVRDRRRVAQPRLARAADVRRGLAQRPPRLPHLSPPRARALAARHLRRR